MRFTVLQRFAVLNYFIFKIFYISLFWQIRKKRKRKKRRRRKRRKKKRRGGGERSGEESGVSELA